MPTARDRTILQCVDLVLQQLGRPAHVREIHERIVDAGLYDFGAKDPIGVVGRKIREHTAPHASCPRYTKTAANTFAFSAAAPKSPLVLAEPPLRQHRRKASRQFVARGADWLPEQTAKDIGLLGEQLVVQYEKQFLMANGRPELADLVSHVSVDQGDGAGYDIKSYTLDGSVKYIEVKSTTAAKDSPFLITANELEFAQLYSESFYLYRVYQLDGQTRTANLYICQGDPTQSFELEPTEFRASP